VQYLLATASVHVTAAACDALTGRLRGDDVVTVLGVVEETAGGATPRDLDDALNVARARLTGAEVRTERREDAPDRAIPAVAREVGADRIVMGLNDGRPDSAGLGGTTGSVLAGTDRPVLVVPVDDT
jgi:nucleotide-binding universal stress UspA family protein